MQPLVMKGDRKSSDVLRMFLRNPAPLEVCSSSYHVHGCFLHPRWLFVSYGPSTAIQGFKTALGIIPNQKSHNLLKRFARREAEF